MILRYGATKYSQPGVLCFPKKISMCPHLGSPIFKVKPHIQKKSGHFFTLGRPNLKVSSRGCKGPVVVFSPLGVYRAHHVYFHPSHVQRPTSNKKLLFR